MGQVSVLPRVEEPVDQGGRQGQAPGDGTPARCSPIRRDHHAEQSDHDPGRRLHKLLDEHSPRGRRVGPIVRAPEGGDLQPPDQIVGDARDQQGRERHRGEHRERERTIPGGVGSGPGLAPSGSTLRDPFEDGRRHRRQEEDRMRPGRQGGGTEQGRHDPARPTRPALQDQESQHDAQARVPVALGHRLEVATQVERQEDEVGRQAGEHPAQASSTPGGQEHAQRDQGRGIERIERPGPAPAEGLPQQPGQIDRAREVVAADVAIRPDARVPRLGQRGERVGVARPRPEQVMRQPGGQERQAGRGDEDRQAAGYCEVGQGIHATENGRAASRHEDASHGVSTGECDQRHPDPAAADRVGQEPLEVRGQAHQDDGDRPGQDQHDERHDADPGTGCISANPHRAPRIENRGDRRIRVCEKMNGRFHIRNSMTGSRCLHWS